MDNKKLQEALKLKEQIEELEEFLEYMSDINLKGEVKVIKHKMIFKYISWRKKEKIFKFNDRLTFWILMQVEKELEDLKLRYASI